MPDLAHPSEYFDNSENHYQNQLQVSLFHLHISRKDC